MIIGVKKNIILLFRGRNLKRQTENQYFGQSVTITLAKLWHWLIDQNIGFRFDVLNFELTKKTNKIILLSTLFITTMLVYYKFKLYESTAGLCSCFVQNIVVAEDNFEVKTCSSVGRVISVTDSLSLVL